MRGAGRSDEPTIIMAANSSWNLMNFRAPIIARLKEQGYKVSAAVPNDDASRLLRGMDVDVHCVPIDAHGLSPLRDVRLLLSYYTLLKRLRPAAFLAFTAKPNIYGSLAAARLGIPVINTITGLGTGFLSGRALQHVVANLYWWSLRHSVRVFFHNPNDRDLFIHGKMVTAAQAAVVPGSGVDLKAFCPIIAPAHLGPLTFLFVGRFLKDKGALEFAEAAALLRQTTSAQFVMLGSVEDHPRAVAREQLEGFVADGIIRLVPPTDDVRPFIAEADCIVLPSYREGLPRVLLEASAMAKPIVAADVPGCRHVVEHNLTGLLCEPRSAHSLADAMAAIARMSPRQRVAMGERARHKAEREFSAESVARAYLQVLHEI